MKARLSALVLIFCCVTFSVAPLLTKRWNNSGSNTVISWDIYGYWLYLPSFFYDDLGKLNNYDYIHNTYHPGSDTKDQAFVQPETGLYVMNYPCGMAIIELPAFAAGHVSAKALGYKTDGFTKPYQIALTWWCVIVACFGIWMLRRLLLRYFDDWLVALVLGIVCLATNYLNFVAFSPMTHAFLFTIYACIIYLTDLYWADTRKTGYIIAIGLLSGLATITRPTEIICALIPLLWGVRDMRTLQERIRFLLGNVRVPVLFVLAAFVAALPQLLYWHHYAGHWLFFSYHGDDKTFSFRHPHVINVLFSYKKGWFMYTPVMILSMLGFYQLYRSYRQLFWAAASFTVLNIYLISAWDCWWYGGSFSMRPMIDSYPLLMFPMAAFLDDTLRRRWWRYMVVAFLAFCLWLNILMTYQSNGSFKYGMMDGDNTSRAYYWRIFGKTNTTLKDKKLLDTDEELPERLESSMKEIYKVDLTKEHLDSLAEVSGALSIVLDSERQWSGKYKVPVDNTIRKGWYRVYATAYYPDKEWNMWDNTQLCFGFYKGDQQVKEKIIRIQRITDQGWPQEVYVDLKVPHNKDYDALIVHLWQANSQKPIYISNIKVAYTPEE